MHSEMSVIHAERSLPTREEWAIWHSDIELPLHYPLFNLLSRGEARVLCSLRFGIPLVATLGLEMDILEANPRSEGNFL
jgi:hypothetical protein